MQIPASSTLVIFTEYVSRPSASTVHRPNRMGLNGQRTSYRGKSIRLEDEKDDHEDQTIWHLNTVEKA